ncbi:Inner membrane transport permease YadH [Candidatus Kinetoplastibacterium sorsogonicusi]|uniref:Transport permease protein n=1 Tax=Candidatus Kinetoplastidibacterium kentomonadis TaxID=1576550 RepID=A0A3Q8EQY5_9PROT|nr:ABC transporter permease [Candidatus Kinetoplastibacterium sorsogonicusi]AWD32173.1 Inner membrane transport permease YadH [Candidatus Kinetoplastibacterium sorsogonicusi]
MVKQISYSNYDKYHFGFITLLNKELLRFYKVSFQTIAAPIMNAMLYLLIFSQVLNDKIIYDSVGYLNFIIPGLIIMTIMQNAFSNPSSSILQSKISGNLIFILITPLTNIEILLAYLLAAIVRGIIVGVCVFFTSYLIYNNIYIHNIYWVLSFSILASGIMGILGIIAGIYTEKYDQLAAFQNFLITPLTMLSGVFYIKGTLPKFWQQLSTLNPIFYIIDGFRYGFLLKSDTSPWISLLIATSIFIILFIYAILLLSYGNKLKN